MNYIQQTIIYSIFQGLVVGLFLSLIKAIKKHPPIRKNTAIENNQKEDKYKENIGT